MKIIRVVSQHRRDFQAIYGCDSCDATEEGSGYDDSFFHNNVIPAMKCSSCGETAPKDYEALEPKYDSEVVI